MTKVNIKGEEPRKQLLGDLKSGDFFLDEDGHLCIYMSDEIENIVWYYDFCSQRHYNHRTDKKVIYLTEVNISY